MSSSKPQGKSLAARIFSLEGLLAAFGLFSLGSGVWHGELVPVFWGATILIGLLALVAVRRRDWQKHWQELDSQRSGKNGDADQR